MFMPRPDTANLDLVDRVFGKVGDKAEAKGRESLTEDERVVYLVWAALGLISNGSLQYFFENGMDPETAARAFQKLNLNGAAECFRLAESLLPKDYRKLSWHSLLRCLEQKEAALDALARRILAGEKEAEVRLAAHISSDPDLRKLSQD
jgi:hypothetical protein